MAKEKSLKVLGIDALRKKYPDSNTASISIPSKEDTLWLPSDILAVNAFLGGGIPYGRILEILGYESTGKSLLAKAFARVCQSLGGKVLWDDAEACWSNHWAELNGLDPEGVEVLSSNALETVSDWAKDMIVYWRSQLINNEPILWVVDSLAALELLDNMDVDQSEAKAEMGNRAKKIGDMWRKRNGLLKRYGICVIVVNQVREKLGTSPFEDKETTPGGKATAYWASQRVALVRSKQIKWKVKGKERKVGQNIILQHRKNKVAPPQDSIYLKVFFRKENEYGYVGYSKYDGIVDYLLDDEAITKKGSRFYYKDKMVANGEEAFMAKFHEDDELRSRIIKKSSINTPGKTRKKLESIGKNMFPVKAKKSEEDE